MKPKKIKGLEINITVLNGVASKVVFSKVDIRLEITISGFAMDGYF
ncbi:MAG: hypothetical protein ACI9LO_001039 [Planctomycetota bacterium]